MAAARRPGEYLDGPPPLVVVRFSRSAFGALRIHRGLVQSAPSAFCSCLRFADELREQTRAPGSSDPDHREIDLRIAPRINDRPRGRYLTIPHIRLHDTRHRVGWTVSRWVVKPLAVHCPRNRGNSRHPEQHERGAAVRDERGPQPHNHWRQRQHRRARQRLLNGHSRDIDRDGGIDGVTADNNFSGG